MLKRALEGVGVARRNQGWRSWRARSLGTEVPKERVECVVIGAGVVGTAVARELALRGREVLVLDSAPTFGTGNTSRNSEVIHAGIYYPPDSLKVLSCIYTPSIHSICRLVFFKKKCKLMKNFLLSLSMISNDEANLCFEINTKIGVT